MHLAIFTASTAQSGVLQFRLVNIEFRKLNGFLSELLCEVNSRYLNLSKHILEALCHNVLELLV